jgi:hypothetical protein
MQPSGLHSHSGSPLHVVEILEWWLKFSHSVVDFSPGAQLAEALDAGVNKIDWLETSWSQALLLTQNELYTQLVYSQISTLMGPLPCHLHILPSTPFA